jgi:CRP-like cAMP-binding protein
MDAPVRPVGNALLDSLPPNELALLRPELERVPLRLRQDLQNVGQPLSHIWFIRSGVASMVSAMADGTSVEVATIGRESVVGVSIVLEADEMAQHIFIQIEGEADRLPKEAFRALRDRLPALNRIMLRAAAALMTQIAQGSACNRMHPIEARCARWLLQTRDRVDSDHFYLTQEFLAQMLGVTRPSVTIAAGVLQKSGVIEYNRGDVTIVDRARLEEAACECYGIVKGESERLVSSS